MRYKGSVNVPPVSANLERAAAWSWRLLVCAAAALVVLAVLWYLRVIVLPMMVALTIAPALAPLVRQFRRVRLERPAAGFALLVGLAVVAGLVAVVTTSVLAQYDELADSLTLAVNDIADRLEGEPFNLSLDRSEDLEASLSRLMARSVRVPRLGRAGRHRPARGPACWP